MYFVILTDQGLTWKQKKVLCSSLKPVPMFLCYFLALLKLSGFKCQIGVPSLHSLDMSAT